MSGNEIGSAGTLFYISPSPGSPATVLIDGVVDAGEAGPSRKEIDVTDLSDKWRRIRKGLLDAGKVMLSGNYKPNDRGQAILRQAVRMDSAYNFKTVYTDGTTDEYSAQVLSFKTDPGQLDGVAKFKADLAAVGALVNTAAA